MSDSSFPYRGHPNVRSSGSEKLQQKRQKPPQDDEAFMAQLQLALSDHEDVNSLVHLQEHAGCCAHQINDQWVLMDPQGVVFWERASTLIVADLHLEKGSSFARRGQLIPPYDTGSTLRRLSQLVEKWSPRRVIALGDSFHDREASSRLPLPAQETIKLMMEKRDWVWITGNHDPEPPVGLGGDVMEELREGGLIFRHEPKVDDSLGEFAGHLHPKAKLVRRGRHIRRPCFVANQTRMVLPSFGAYTGGLDVFHSAFEGLFSKQDFVAFMRGDKQVYRIAARDLKEG